MGSECDWYDDVAKDFIKDMESKGYLITKDNLYCDFCCGQGSGASFAAKIDVLKIIDRWDPEGTKYPRLRRMWKEDQFKITVVKTSSNYCHEYTMDACTEDYSNGEENTDDLSNVAETILEGGTFEDGVANLQGAIIEEARELARKFHKECETMYLDELKQEEN